MHLGAPYPNYSSGFLKKPSLSGMERWLGSQELLLQRLWVGFLVPIWQFSTVTPVLGLQYFYPPWVYQIPMWYCVCMQANIQAYEIKVIFGGGVKNLFLRHFCYAATTVLLPQPPQGWNRNAATILSFHLDSQQSATESKSKDHNIFVIFFLSPQFQFQKNDYLVLWLPAFYGYSAPCKQYLRACVCACVCVAQLDICFSFCSFRARQEWYKLSHGNPQVTLSVKVKTLTTFLRYAAGVSLQLVISHSTMHNTLSTSISQLQCHVNLKGHLKSLHSSCTHCWNTTTSNGMWQLSKLKYSHAGTGLLSSSPRTCWRVHAN